MVKSKFVESERPSPSFPSCVTEDQQAYSSQALLPSRRVRMTIPAFWTESIKADTLMKMQAWCVGCPCQSWGSQIQWGAVGFSYSVMTGVLLEEMFELASLKFSLSR